MNIEKIREALERIANDLSPNSLPIDAAMEGPNGLTVRAIADRCFDDAREALAELDKAQQPREVLTDEEALAIAIEYGYEIGHIKEYMEWATPRINARIIGPVVTHMNIDPNASQETKASVAEVVKAAYSYKAPKVLTVDEAMEACWRWAIDAKMVNATTETYYLNNDLRARLTAAINAKAAKQ